MLQLSYCSDCSVRAPVVLVTSSESACVYQLFSIRRKITRLRTCGGSQMTNEDIREYLSSSCANLTNHVRETHFGFNKRRWQWFRHLVVTSVTSKNSGSVVVTRLIIWSTHGELFLQTLRRTVTIAQPETMRQCAEREVGKDNLDTG